MKHTLTLFTCIISCLFTIKSSAQHSRIIGTLGRAFENGSWQDRNSLTFIYNDPGNGGNFEDFGLYSTLKYDTVIYKNSLNGGPLVEDIRYVHVFDNQNRIAEYLNLDGNISNRIMNSYDSDNNISEIVEQYWNNNAWQNSQKRTFTYDIDHNILFREAFTWNTTTSNWQQGSRSYYTYDQNGLTTGTTLSHNISTTSFDTFSRTFYHYSSGLNDTSWLNTYSNNSITSRARTTKLYQGNSLSFSLTQKWDGNTWKDDERKFIQLHGPNNTYAGDSSQRWENNAWITWDVERYVLDNNDDAVSRVWRTLSTSNILVNSLLDSFTYNAHHQKTWERTYIWNNNSSSWTLIPNYYEFYYYYENYTNDVDGITLNNTKLEVFPSPARDNITIRANFETPEAFKVRIYDMQGRLVLQLGEKATKEYNKNIPLYELASGNYILQIAGSKAQAQQKFTILK